MNHELSDSPKRVMIYCQDSFGLGHLRRNVNIALELSRRQPATAALFVADSPLAPFFALPPNSDFVKLPTIVKLAAGDWRVHRLPSLTPEQLLRIRSQLIREVALSYRPDILLVDHMPHGARGELVECLHAVRQAGFPTRIVLGLRDILGAPEDIVPQWRERAAYDLLEQFYDDVLVYGSREIYDLGAAYAFPDSLQRKIHYCGYVATRRKQFPKAAAKLSAEFELPKPFTALVMAGGGSDAFFLMDAMLEAVRYLGDAVPFNTFMLTGPFMPAPERKVLEEQAAGLPVVVRRFRDDSTKILQLADLVVSMAGYNTTCEILQFARRAVIVPREGPSAEQTMRTRLLQQRGLLRAIHPRDLTPRVLAENLMQCLREPPSPLGHPGVDLNGASRAAEILLATRAGEGERETSTPKGTEQGEETHVSVSRLR